MKVYGDCSECDRPIRSNRVPLAEAPGTITYGASGMCQTCYSALLRPETVMVDTTKTAAVIADTAAGNYGFLGKATPVELVRWFEDAQGWDYRTVKGIHRGHTATHWRVEVLGEVVEYDRAVWEVTVP